MRQHTQMQSFVIKPETSQHGIRVRPGISVSIHGQTIGSNLCFRNPEKLLEGVELRVIPTYGNDISCYRVIVNYQGVLSGQN